MEDKLLDELIASYKGDAFADWLKGAVEKNGDLVTAEKIIDDYSFRHAGSQIPGTIGYSVNYWPRVKKEFDKLVCGHSQYAKGRLLCFWKVFLFGNSIFHGINTGIYYANTCIYIDANNSINASFNDEDRQKRLL